jgi:hypothetical protein
MRVKNKNHKECSLLFKDLPVGDCFTVDADSETIYLKIEPLIKGDDKRQFNSVDIKEGKVYTSNNVTVVFPVEGYFVEE